MIKKHGGIFGRNPTFNDVTVEGTLNIEGPIVINGDTFSGLDYDGTWNASTNTPTLTSSVGTLGHFYIVSVAGSTDLNGETNWGVGDWAVFNGSVWQKVDGGSTGLLTTLTVTGNTYLATTSGDVGIGTSSPGAKLDVVAGDNNGLQYRTATRTVGIGQISGEASVYWGSGTRLNFSSSAVTYATITAAGDVGIGTTSPQSRLEVRQDQAGAITRVIANNNSATSGSGSAFDYYFGTTRLGGLIHAFGASAYLGFDVWSGSSATERMRITAAGDVGIGTSSPASKLHVSGSGDISRFTNGSVTLFGYSDSQGLGWFTGAAGTGVGVYYNHSNNYQGFYTASTEKVRIDTSGNVGIGTTSPLQQLHLSSASATGMQITYQGVGASRIGVAAGNALTFGLDTSNGTTERMRIDASGNLGLGVTPSAWGSGYRAIDNLLYNSSYSNNGGLAGMAFNAFNNGTNWIYKNTTFANRFESTLDSFRWYTAPSGTAGNAISFTQAMTLDASGDFIVGGTTTNSIRLTAEKSNPTRGILAHVVNSAGSSQTGSQILFTQNGIANFVIGQPAGVNAFALWGGRNTAADGTEFMRFDSSGNLGIGTSSPTEKLTVSGAGVFSRVGINANAINTVSTAQSFVRFQTTGADFYVGTESSTGGVFFPGSTAYAAVLYNSNATPMQFYTAGSERARIPAAGGMVVGTAALATTATDGFMYVPTCAGTPTGTPTTQTGTAPIIVDTTNNKLYFYSGGQWRDAGP